MLADDIQFPFVCTTDTLSISNHYNHFVHEGAAQDEWRMTYINTHKNEADLLTKQLPSGEKRKSFVQRLLHHIFRS